MLEKGVIFLLLTIIVSCGDFPKEIQSDKNVKTTNTTASQNIKVESIVIEKDFFTILIPSELKKQPISGEDSNLSVFSNESISVSLEYGWTTNRVEASLLRRYSEYQEEWKTIDNERAKVVTFNYGEQSDTLKDPSKECVLAAYFAPSSRVKTHLTVWISYRPTIQKVQAKEIIESIRFKSI